MDDLYLAERYQVLHKIGSGGSGEVYAVFDKHLQKQLALKTFCPDEDIPTDDDSFFNEYLLNHSLSGKNFVRAYDYGYTGNNHPFYTMDLLPPGNIDEELQGRDIQVKLECCRQICMALSFLHFLDLIHNDLKPENIKLVDDDGRPCIKLLDLGLTINFDPDSPSRRLSGTVEYMAPELFESRNPNHKSDLYSLGVIFYKLITAKLPFSGNDPLLVISDKLEKQIPPIDPDSSEFPPEMIELTMRLLDRNPANRPESAFEVARIIADMAGFSSMQPHFEDIINSTIGLKISRQLEKEVLRIKTSRNFLTHDMLQIQKLVDLLKARLQGKYLNVQISDSNGENVSAESPVSCKAKGTATIKVTSLSAKNRISKSDFNDDELTFNILLSPHFGEGGMDFDFFNLNIDLVPEMERWISEKNLNQEVVDKFRKISSHDASFLSRILADMQESDILRFNGSQWTCEPEKFVSFPIPSDLQKSALDCLEYLPEKSKAMIRRLSIMRHEFDRHFVRKYLNGLTDDPDGVLAQFTADRILSRYDDYFSFRDEFLRVGLVNTIPSRDLQRFHLRAAGIIESSGGVRQQERVLNLAHNYTHGGDLKEAVKWTLKAAKTLIAHEEYRVALKMVLAVLRLAENSPAEEATDFTAALLAVQGDIENKLGMSRRSLRTFSRIVRMKNRLSDRTILARAYKNAGDLYKATCNYEKGLKALEKALPIYIELGNKTELSHTYNNIGNIYWVASKIDMALENYERALKLQEELNLEKELASTLNNMGSCYIIKNRLDKTIEYYKRSIEIKKRINDRPELARTYNNLGAVYHELGNVPEALVYLYDALKINREIDSRGELLFNLDNITACEIALGHFQKAETYMAEGLQIAQELESQQMQAMFMQHKAMILFHSGVFGQAHLILQAARRIVDRITDQNLEFEIHRNFCRIYLTMHTPEPFWKALDAAEKLARKIEDKKAIISAMALRCHALVIFEMDYHNARDINHKALKLAREINAEYQICSILLNELMLAVESGESSEIDLEEIEVLIAKPVNQINKSGYFFLLARQAMNQGQYDKAREYLSEASSLAEIQGLKSLLWKIKYLQGKIEQALLNYEQAYVNLRQAVTILKSLAQTISNEEYLKSFLNNPTSLLLRQEISDLAKRMGQK